MHFFPRALAVTSPVPSLTLRQSGRLLGFIEEGIITVKCWGTEVRHHSKCVLDAFIYVYAYLSACLPPVTGFYMETRFN